MFRMVLWPFWVCGKFSIVHFLLWGFYSNFFLCGFKAVDLSSASCAKSVDFEFKYVMNGGCFFFFRKSKIFLLNVSNLKMRK